MCVSPLGTSFPYLELRYFGIAPQCARFSTSSAYLRLDTMLPLFDTLLRFAAAIQLPRVKCIDTLLLVYRYFVAVCVE